MHVNRQDLLGCSKTELIALIASDKNRLPAARLKCAIHLFDKLGALHVNNHDAVSSKNLLTL